MSFHEGWKKESLLGDCDIDIIFAINLFKFLANSMHTSVKSNLITKLNVYVFLCVNMCVCVFE